MKQNGSTTYMHLLLVAIIASILAACASIGRPTGGEYDIEPPKFVTSNPLPRSTGHNDNRITIDFNENIKVEDAINKVVVSPAQKAIPKISANGRRLTIDIQDSLVPNTTYTIDFSDAIRDLNEGNELDGFAIDFATGDSIDSLRISGMMFEARTLEPAQGMIVGVYSNLSDTAITTLPMERIAKTNQLGQFTIRGIKPGIYRLFAVNDINRDYHWDRSEDVAFYDSLIVPLVTPKSVNDTLKTHDGLNDSIVVRHGVEFLPNDILLTWFNEGYKAQYLQDYSREERRKITIQFAAQSDTLPTITLLNEPRQGYDINKWAILSRSENNDTLNYYITDTLVSNLDTLKLAMRYLRTDTLQNLTWGDDTIRVIYKAPKVNTKELEKKKKKEEERKAEERKKFEELGDTLALDSLDSIASIPPIPQLTHIDIKAKSGTSQDVNLPVYIEFNQPIDTIIRQGLHFEQLRDTLWDTITMPDFKMVNSHNRMLYNFNHQWEPATKYRFTIDSACVVGAYNEWNTPFKHEFTTRALEDYSALFLNISGVDSCGIVELLGSDDKVIRTAPVENSSAAIEYLQPATYYLRLYIDRNRNGKWDTGSVNEMTQPEEVYYYPKKITLKKNWDVEQSWNIDELPIDRQKPTEIKKNKPKEKKRRRNPDGTYVDDSNHSENGYDEEEDGYYDDNNAFGPAGSRNSFGNTGAFNRLGGLR